MSCESFEKMGARYNVWLKRGRSWKQNSELSAQTFEEEYEDLTVVLMHKDDSTNRDWNVQTHDMKTMSLTFYVLGLLWSKTESAARILFTHWDGNVFVGISDRGIKAIRYGAAMAYQCRSQRIASHPGGLKSWVPCSMPTMVALSRARQRFSSDSGA